jgi:hypothetical protein
MDASDSIGVYGEAKAEYTRQLCSFLVPALESYFLDLLAEVKTTEKDPKRLLWVFQDSLKQFPDWNIDKVQRETEKIQSATRCDYLEEILTAVFIAHTKVLSAIRLTSRQKKLQITIPKLDHFLHRTMSECARLLWSNAYLFAENSPAIERQKNLRQVEHLLHEGVLQSIRGMLPVKSILKEYLAEDTEDTEAPAAVQQEQEEEVAPVIHEESLAPSAPAQEDSPKEPPAPANTPEPAADLEPAQTPAGPVIDLSGSPPPVPNAPPTIVIETEPPTVGFTHMDAVLDMENPDQTTITASPHLSLDENEDDGEVTRIEIDTSVAPEPLDDFEDLEGESSDLAVGEDEFETL